MNFHVPNIIVNILLTFFVVIVIISLVKILALKKNGIIIVSNLDKPKAEKNMVTIYLIWSSILSWCIFYSVTNAGFLSDGEFGFKTGLFLTPLWLITIMVIVKDFLVELKESYKRNTHNAGNILAIIVAFVIFLYCFSGIYGVCNHWQKENTKGMVQQWYAIEGYKEKTILYYGAKFGFSYYMEKDPRYSKSLQKNIIPMFWLLNGDYYEYNDMFNNLMKGDYSAKTMYLCAAHKADDINTILRLLRDKGYTSTIIYDSCDATIYKLTKIKT